MGGILLALVGIAGYSVWNSYFRYQAYGTVTGRLIQVSPAGDGVLRSLHVREGDTVRQGQLLLTVDNIELQQRHAQLGDELRIAQANLEAEGAKLKWQSAFNLDQGHGARALYFESLGTLLREQARQDDLRTQLRRAELLLAGKAISQDDMEQLRFSAQGQGDLVAKLKDALAELERRADQADLLLKKGTQLSAGLEDNGRDQLKPLLAKIEALEAERTRLQERLDQGQVRAPTNGLVVKVLRFAGEHCKPGEPVVSLLEEGSLQVVLYMPQGSSTALAPDARVKLMLDPYPEPLTCRVQRLGDQFEPPPEHIKRHYREGQRLLPVYLQPSNEESRWMALRLGGVVKLSYLGPNIQEAPSD